MDYIGQLECFDELADKFGKLADGRVTGNYLPDDEEEVCSYTHASWEMYFREMDVSCSAEVEYKVSPVNGFQLKSEIRGLKFILSPQGTDTHFDNFNDFLEAFHSYALDSEDRLRPELTGIKREYDAVCQARDIIADILPNLPSEEE